LTLYDFSAAAVNRLFISWTNERGTGETSCSVVCSFDQLRQLVHGELFKNSFPWAFRDGRLTNIDQRQAPSVESKSRVFSKIWGSQVGDENMSAAIAFFRYLAYKPIYNYFRFGCRHLGVATSVTLCGIVSGTVEWYREFGGPRKTWGCPLKLRRFSLTS